MWSQDQEQTVPSPYGASQSSPEVLKGPGSQVPKQFNFKTLLGNWKEAPPAAAAAQLQKAGQMSQEIQTLDPQGLFGKESHSPGF